MQRILIANRGEVVERVVRTCRRMGIETVAIHSDADRDARYVDLADAAVDIGGTTPAESYLVQERVVDAALAAGADAVHPGYGFLAENAAFARRCRDAGLVFIGPSPDAIETMGDKVAAKAAVGAAGVPLLPAVEVDGAGVPAEHLAAVGLPAIVKAAAGGGGKGMHVVTERSQLVAHVERAQREAASAFGDGRVFVERYVAGARHVEIQVFGDEQGSMAVLHERECSVQRRHQKVVEEAPSPAVDAALRRRLGDAAARAARAVDYVGAGTVEFLLGADGSFWFLEMNTRLQVEHAVTEEVTGLDLVELQIRVARGEPLPADALDPPLRGHAIEARLYAEDPAAGFAPSAGRLARFALAADGLRVESGVRTGDTVSPFYDPMLAKLVAHAPDRAEAAGRLAARLAESQVHGVTTNRDLLVRVLRDERFLAGDVDTQYLDGPGGAALARPLVEPAVEGEHAIAAALAAQAGRRAAAPQLGGLPSGWRNNRAGPQVEELAGRHGTWRVAYAFERDGVSAQATCNGETVAVGGISRCEPGRVDLVVAGVRRRFDVLREAGHAWVTGHGGSSALTPVPRHPRAGRDEAGSLVAPMPGVVLRVHTEVGDRVEQGDVVAVLEAMKMEIEVVAPEAGEVVELGVRTGDRIDAGRVLAVIEAPDADHVEV